MRHIPITCEQREAMLRAVGVSGVDELFVDVPADARLGHSLAVPEGMSEIDLVAHMHELADRNTAASALVTFAGAGCYDHHIPSVVDHVLRRPEFFTAYTPYQPEVSQGTLQAIFEYQTGICELTGMDVSNASMYDGATALAEAVFMAARVTKRDKVVVSRAIHPGWRRVLETYSAAGIVEPVYVDMSDGRTRAEDIRAVADEAAAVVVASPNFVGAIEDLGAIGGVAADSGALLVVASNPVLLGVMEPPSAYGADIVVGEGQPLGNAMSFGGPGLGFFACRQKHVRQMPGRLVGKTVDVDGNEAYVLTLATREQHIRREKATSNICSNHALNALAAGAYLAAVGSEGLTGIATACVSKAHYLRGRLLETGRFTAPWDAPFGYEFALRYDGDVAEMHARLLERGFLAGVDAGALDASLAGLVVFAVTEKRTRAQIDAFVEAVAAL